MDGRTTDQGDGEDRTSFAPDSDAAAFLKSTIDRRWNALARN